LNPIKVIHILIHLAAISLIFSCSKPLQSVSTNKENIVIGPSGYSKSLPSIDSLIQPYRIPLQKTMNEVVAVTDAAATKALPECGLGNLICDIMLSYSERVLSKHADIAFYNMGGLRIELPKGNITLSMIFELVPFENELVTIDVLGKDLNGLFQQVALKKGGPIAGCTMGISSKGATNIKVGGKEIEPERTYSIISNDYLINGGDNYIMPPYTNRQNLKVKFRDAVLEELKNYKSKNIQLHPTTDGRIYLLDTP
jgi:2',3'-cyclic-nucleotide 2'-phosphodiesterase (5'-nucleotidase family)